MWNCFFFCFFRIYFLQLNFFCTLDSLHAKFSVKILVFFLVLVVTSLDYIIFALFFSKQWSQRKISQSSSFLSWNQPVLMFLLEKNKIKWIIPSLFPANHFLSCRERPMFPCSCADNKQLVRPPGSSLTCAALSLHGPHEVVGSLLTVQWLQQVEHIIIKHEVDQVEGPCVQRDREKEKETRLQNRLYKKYV